MDVHAPHDAVHSWKDALVHIALITVGVLIALSFEGISSWREHRALVREARANLTNEIDDNRKELQLVLKGMDETDAQLQHGIAVTEALLTRTAVQGDATVGIGTRLANFEDASHATAEATGAFGLMDYAEVKTYASVYNHQERFLRAQNDFLENMTLATAAESALTDLYTDKPIKRTPSTQEIEELRHDIRLCIASSLIERSLAGDLMEDYDRILKQH